MKLYYAKGACSLTIRILINELGIPCEFESVDLKAKKTESGEDFLKINPKGYVPVLAIDDQTVLTENPAIQIYLADKYKATQLLPPIDDFNRYRVIEWLAYIGSELHKTAGVFFNPKIPDNIKNEIFMPSLKQKLDFIDKNLQKNKYLIGDQFTLGDMYLFVILSWLPKFKIELKQWPNIERYFADLKAKKSIKAALKTEELE